MIFLMPFPCEKKKINPTRNVFLVKSTNVNFVYFKCLAIYYHWYLILSSVCKFSDFMTTITEFSTLKLCIKIIYEFIIYDL